MYSPNKTLCAEEVACQFYPAHSMSSAASCKTSGSVLFLLTMDSLYPSRPSTNTLVEDMGRLSSFQMKTSITLLDFAILRTSQPQLTSQTWKTCQPAPNTARLAGSSIRKAIV